MYKPHVAWFGPPGYEAVGRWLWRPLIWGLSSSLEQATVFELACTLSSSLEQAEVF